ncbi:MAG: transposase [Deltaproteobacteria bacterium]|nr:transposase [Deltaproteobacteria bacterium]
MSRKRFTPEQIIEKLREAEILINKGQNMAEVFRKLGVSEQTCYRHRRQGRFNRIRWLDSSLSRGYNYRGEVRIETRYCSPRFSWRPFLKDAPGIQETYPHPYQGFSSGST